MATSFPTSDAGRITSGVQGVKLEKESEDEGGFVTEEEEDEDATVTIQRLQAKADHANGSSSETESEEESTGEESSSEDEAPQRLLLRPTFIKKSQRKESSAWVMNGHSNATATLADPAAAEEAAVALRKAKADTLIRDQLEKDAAARAAEKKAWDDDADNQAGEDEAYINDTDGLDPAAEFAAWKLRELKRVKREREAVEVAEKEREEVERRRNLSAEQRDREDREFISKQKEEREAGRGKAGFMQRYFHKGAFFQQDSENQGLNKRDLMGSRYVDEVRDREVLPQYLQVRDMTKIGRKGRTRYRDLRSEDTGRWGVDGYTNRPAGSNKSARFGITDERYVPDRREGNENRGARPTVGDGTPSRQRSRSRSKSRSRYRSRSRSQSRSQLRSRSRSPPSRRERYGGDHRNRQKRSLSPYPDRDKRRRLDSMA
jgi:microfibrillar-associated protein 1